MSQPLPVCSLSVFRYTSKKRFGSSVDGAMRLMLPLRHWSPASSWYSPSMPTARRDTSCSGTSARTSTVARSTTESSSLPTPLNSPGSAKRASTMPSMGERTSAKASWDLASRRLAAAFSMAVRSCSSRSALMTSCS